MQGLARSDNSIYKVIFESLLRSPPSLDRSSSSDGNVFLPDQKLGFALQVLGFCRWLCRCIDPLSMGAGGYDRFYEHIG